MHRYLVIIIIVLFIAACARFEPSARPAESMLDGVLDGLTRAERVQHLKGDALFTDAVFTRETGLGPVFVSNACAGCHAGDGKGHLFTALTRFGQSDNNGNLFIGRGGPQLQNRAIPGFMPEVLPDGVASTKLVAPAISGLGFIDAVTDADLIAMADPTDADADGISGELSVAVLPSYVVPRASSITQNGKYICRFGKKAAAYDLLMQTARAYNQDMGIVSAYEPVDPYSNLESDPEVSLQDINDNVFYQKTLRAPVARNQGDADVTAGRKFFVNIGCARCHQPVLKTGASPIEALAYKNFFPYSDLLLHDMGMELNDGYTEGSAKPAEWRTPALWGLGLSKNSQGGNYFLLHDGRATSIVQAILMHGGEGNISRANYNSLGAADKQMLLKFLESL